MGKTPFEGHGTAYVLGIVGATRRPGVSVHHKGLRHIDHLVARGHAFLHRKGVEEWLDRTSDLALALTHIVVLEIAVVRAADIGAHLAGTGFYCHKGRPEYGLVVLDGVVRSHERIRISFFVPGKYPHLYRLVELRENLSLAETRLALGAVAVAPLAGLGHKRLIGGILYVVRERSPASVAQFPVECRLQIPSEVLADRLLGVALHVGVDGDIYLQAVAVQVVFFPRRLAVFGKPAEERVLAPAYGVRHEVVVGEILVAARRLGAHLAAYHIPEVWRNAGVVVLHLEAQLYGGSLSLGHLLLSDVAGLVHTADYQVPAGLGLVVVQNRIVAGRLVDDADQGGRLLYVQLGWLLGEIRLRGRLYAVGPASEEDGVQVHGYNFVLGIAPFELDGGGPFAQLDPYHLQFVAHFLTRIEGLGELLGDGTSSSLAGIAHQKGAEEHASEALEINAAVLLETGVLGSDGSVDYIGGDVLILDIGPVLDVEGGDYFPVHGNKLGCEIVVRMFKLRKGRDVGINPYCCKQSGYGKHPGGKQGPEPDYNFLSRTIFHYGRKNTH